MACRKGLRLAPLGKVGGTASGSPSSVPSANIFTTSARIKAVAAYLVRMTLALASMAS
jgi:hypothetical protein